MNYWDWPRIYYEKALAIIKPDAVEKVVEIQEIFEKQGFTTLLKKRIQFTIEQAAELYKHHIKNSYYNCLCKDLAKGPVVAFILGRHDAISALRKLMGPKDPSEARICDRNSIRALYGISTISNAIHGSSDIEAYRREMHLIFPNEIIEPFLTGQISEDYFQTQISPVVLKGLTELCKQKPKFPVLWLADWLDENNPNKPKIEPNYIFEQPFAKYPID